MNASWEEIMNHVKAGGKLRRGMTREDLIGQNQAEEETPPEKEDKDDNRLF